MCMLLLFEEKFVMLILYFNLIVWEMLNVFEKVFYFFCLLNCLIIVIY